MADDAADLPFRAEYAKSDRSSCKGCKSKIAKAELRLAVMVQSPMFDGKTPNWHHVKCFFGRNRPKAVGDIAHFDNLRWEDQEKITKMVADALSGAGPSGKAKGGKSGGKSGGGGSGGISALGTIMGDFRVEVAKAGGAGCRVCEVKIKKGLARIGKKDYDSQRAKMYGPYDRWHHVGCFSEKREELEFFDAGKDLAGFMTLSADAQKEIKEKLPALKGKRKASDGGDANSSANGGKDEPDAKKPKLDDKAKEKLKKQMKKLYYYRDMLERNLNKKELEEWLEFNDQELAQGNDRMLDRLADCMLFGALDKCKVCSGGQFVFKSGVGYVCTGDISEWTKCQEKTDEPGRKAFKIPPEYKDQYDFCKLYKYKAGQARIMQHNPSTVKSSQESIASSNGNSSQKSGIQSSVPLKNLTFVLSGSGIDKGALKADIEKLGGKVVKTLTETTAAVVSDKDSVAGKKLSKNIQAAKDADIQVVSDDLLADIKTKGIVECIKDKTISEWGAEPKDRIGKLLEKAQKSSSSAGSSRDGSDIFKADLPKSMKLKLKGGAYVDPESGMEHKAHVLKKGDDLFSVVLGAVDIQRGVNSYYKLQLLQHDKKHKWYVFRSWGRVGTTIGGTKLEDFDEKDDALENFKYIYEDKTGNSWRNHKNFVKRPGKFFPMDLDLGGDSKEIKKLDKDAGSRSKLHKAVQDLVRLIFDVDTMKKAMVEFEIDLNKMPLGKISKKQIESAYKILQEVQDLINNNGEGSETKFLDASNRFFTLIPHDFGMKAPPILNNVELIKSKIDMLDSLLEIEVAYNLLQTDEKENDKDPLDAHYDKLATKLEVVDAASDEFAMLTEYVKNTHAATHTMYSLEVEQIFRVRRKGEEKRFKPFREQHKDKRMLLWHGSRTTNYAGILSQGLRIAPPEAPSTGYMFGKGIYFADMVSKSANYCCTTKSNNTGLMMLCDVALGNMYERTNADYIEKLPKGYHSTKGLGKTEPDPSQSKEIDGAKVPLGKAVKSANQTTSLLYNEYIIYDVKQCNVKYLFRMRFDYKF